MRTRLLAKLIAYCTAHLAEIAVAPYHDAGTQAKMVAMYKDAIGRAMWHIGGYHKSAMYEYKRTLTMRPGESCAAFVDRAVSA